MKFKILQSASRPLQGNKPTHPRPRPLSFTHPQTQAPFFHSASSPSPFWQCNERQHHQSLPKSCQVGGSGKEPKGTDCSLEKPNGRNSPPPARGLSKFQRGSLRALRDLKCTMIIIGGGSNALRRALAKAEKAREKKERDSFRWAPLRQRTVGWGNL